MSLETDAAIAQLDAIREQRGITSPLILEKATVGPYQALGDPITIGWAPSYLPATNNEAQTILIRLAESSQWDVMNMRYVAALQFNGVRYKVKSDPPPLGEPRVWKLKGQPTGEKTS